MKNHLQNVRFDDNVIYYAKCKLCGQLHIVLYNEFTHDGDTTTASKPYVICDAYNTKVMILD